MITKNEKAFLDMIAFSEIGEALLAISDNGYNVIVGSTPKKPILFTSYVDHPKRIIDLGNGLKSSAAGRYQLLGRYFDYYKRFLGLPDFGHDSQDKIAIQQIKECRALDDINAGYISIAIAQCARIWASFPNAGYGQRENKMQDLLNAYIKAGGTINKSNT